jgi:hypothetical protein
MQKLLLGLPMQKVHRMQKLRRRKVAIGPKSIG